MTERVPDSQRVSAALDRARWSFLFIVAVGVAVTVAINLGRLPTGARGDYPRGVTDMREGRYASATENLNRAIAIDPGYADALVARASVSTRDGHPYRALVDAEAALKLDDEPAKARYVRGIALRQIGQYDAALVSFDEAIRDEPALGKPLLARANLLFDMGRLDDALADYRSVWALRRNDEAFSFAPLVIWATETLLGAGDEAVAELDGRVRGSLADRARLAPYVEMLRGDSIASGEGDAVVHWILAVRSLAGGKRVETIEGLRAALAKAPAESWVRERAWSMLETLVLGLRVQPANPDLSSSFSFGPGLAVVWVRKDGAADSAGVLLDDRLVRIGDHEASVDALDAIVETGAPGSEVALELDRNGTTVAAAIVSGGGTAFTPGASSPTR